MYEFINLATDEMVYCVESTTFNAEKYLEILEAKDVDGLFVAKRIDPFTGGVAELIFGKRVQRYDDAE